MDIETESEVNEAVRKYEKTENYTYADYAGWETDIRYELIDGKAYAMSAPSAAHQRILVKLCTQFENFLEGKKCRVFIAPFDVCINGKGDEDKDVVQPDVLIICDESILDAKRCNGTPDMAIEILSPSTSRHDRIVKLNLYLKAGVREYWIVDPEDKSVVVHILENGKYVINAYEQDENINVSILDRCTIPLTKVFRY